MAALIWTWEKSTVQSVGARRRKPASNRKEKSIAEEGTVNDILQLKWNLVTKATRRGEEHHWNIPQTVCYCWGQPFVQQSLDNTGMRGIKRFHYSASAHEVHDRAGVSRGREHWNFASPSLLLWPCALWGFVVVVVLFACLFPVLKKYLAGRRFNSRSSLGSAMFQCLSHIPKVEFKRTFLQWIERLWKCVTADGEQIEQFQWKKVVCREENTLKNPRIIS